MIPYNAPACWSAPARWGFSNAARRSKAPEGRRTPKRFALIEYHLTATPGFRIFIRIGKLVCKPALSCSFLAELMAPWQSLS